MLVLTWLQTPLQASDLEKEKRWEDQVKESLMDGEIVYLEDGKNNFFALYTKADKPEKTAVLLLHGSGVHPDWPQVISPLRTQLPESGWTVLSLQLPVLANDSNESYDPLIKEASPRIDAGIQYLHHQGYKKIVIIAHSMGTVMASHYLAKSANNVSGYVSGYIGIGMPEANLQYLDNVQLSLLDLYGSDDLPSVINSAEKRAKTNAKNKGYQQNKVKDADHFFDGKEEKLIEIVLSWLKGR
ncbi:MAG: alpha/beta fold hydrolase [Thiotrichaceae bacterium]